MSTCRNTWVNRDGYELPCGWCPHCKQKRIATWAMRLFFEDRTAYNSHFITLTYDNLHVKRTDNGFLTLSKRDCQLFIKRLRKANKHNPEPIRYYLAGEYGSKGDRPHYHIILFNCDPDTIEMEWGQGSVHFGTAESSSVNYTLKYISKPGRIPMFECDDREPEFQLYSKRLGNCYLTEEIIKFHRANPIERAAVTLPGGIKAPMPKSWKEIIFPNNVTNPYHDLRLQIKSHYTEKYTAEEKKLQEDYQSEDLSLRKAAQEVYTIRDNSTRVQTDINEYLNRNGKI